jgi:soluble lytic murein transglycosylase-like protein
MAIKTIILSFLLLFVTTTQTYEKNHNYTINQDIVYNIASDKADIKIPYKIWNKKQKKYITIYKKYIIPKTVPVDHIWFMIDKANEKQIPLKTMFRLIYKESTFNHKAKSNKNAYGYMQIQHNNYIAYSEKLDIPLFNWKSNIIIGTTILNEYYNYWSKKYKNEKVIWSYTLASYNFGLNNVICYGIPKKGETHEFIKFIQHEINSGTIKRKL